MTTRTTIVVALLMIFSAVVLNLAVFDRLPEQVASHWNAADQVDGTMPRFWGVFIGPTIALCLLGLFLVIPAIDPLKANIARFRRSFNLFIVLIIAFLLYVHVLTILWNLGMQAFRISKAMLPAMGVLFIFIGSMLRQARRNYFIGIRTPWTLASDTVWAKTHRLGAVLFVISGVLAMVGAFFPGQVAYWLVIGPVLLSALVTVVYSYFAWRAETTSA